MKKLQILALLILFGYGGFMVGYFTAHPTPKPTPAVVEKPLTDWKKFYEALKDEKVYIALGVQADPDDTIVSHYDLYFVDEDRWHKVGYAGLGGCCGRKKGPSYHIHSLSRLERELYKPPTDKAKFVAIANGKLSIVEVRFHYKGEDD